MTTHVAKLEIRMKDQLFNPTLVMTPIIEDLDESDYGQELQVARNNLSLFSAAFESIMTKVDPKDHNVNVLDLGVDILIDIYDTCQIDLRDQENVIGGQQALSLVVARSLVKSIRNLSEREKDNINHNSGGGSNQSHHSDFDPNDQYIY